MNIHKLKYDHPSRARSYIYTSTSPLTSLASAQPRKDFIHGISKK